MAIERKVFCKHTWTPNYIIQDMESAGVVELTCLNAEEDLVVIGFKMWAFQASGTRLTQEGRVSAAAVLNQGYSLPEAYRNCLGIVHYYEGLDITAVGSGYMQEMTVDQGMFPEGFGLSLKEGERMVLSMSFNNDSTQADCACSFQCTIYYVKGKL